MEVLKHLLNKCSEVQLPVLNAQLNPNYNDIFKLVSLFDGSYNLAVKIEEVFVSHDCGIEFSNCVSLANQIWAMAYPNYPYKVAWHGSCQGYFEIWKELATNRFYLECDECSTQVDSPEDLNKHKASEYFYELSVYPTLEELEDIDWIKYIIKK
ncbi:hypothetical protein H0178_28670 [Cytobacillus firmus]|uniref:hypothetical protein n=1 Tax=Paenibacillus lautus TaxID=1401 RepID=UPI00384CB9AE|nr:hypothetical protein [Cytobacillus firmus]